MNIFFKSGKVVIVLSGKYAGRKAVVVRASDDGNDAHKFGHAVVAGIDRYPRKVVKAMGKKKIEKRSKVKPFVKTINYNHIFPTRYTVDFDLKKTLTDEALTPAHIVATRKSVKKLFEEKYKAGSGKTAKQAAGSSYFFSKLRF